MFTVLWRHPVLIGLFGWTEHISDYWYYLGSLSGYFITVWLTQKFQVECENFSYFGIGSGAQECVTVPSSWWSQWIWFFQVKVAGWLARHLLGRQKKLVCNWLDPMRVRLVEFLKRLSRIPTSRLSKQHKFLSTKTHKKPHGGRRKQENHSNNLTTMRGGMKYNEWTGQSWSQGWNILSNASWSNTKRRNNPTTVPTWSGDAKLFVHYEFDVLMYKKHEPKW